jgi:putative heme-binding domain-containing protein
VDLVLRLLVDRHPRVRENAARLAERWASTWPVTERLSALADDPDGAVRWQAALSLGEWDSDAVLAPLARIAKSGSADRWTRLAIATAVPTRAGKLVPIIEDLVLVRELSVLVGGRRDPAETGALLKSATSADLRRRAAIVNGLAEGAARRGATLSSILDGLPDAAAAREMLASAAGAALDASRPLPERVDALRLLAHVPWETGSPVLAKALEAGQAIEIRLAAVAAAASHRHEGAAPLLLAPWKSYLPAERREVLEAFARRPDRLAWLLGEIEGGRFLGSDLGPVLVKQLVGHGDAALRERARKTLADVIPPDRSEVIAAYKAAASMKGDAARGRDVFAKNCVACHRIGALGTAVGPDISDTLSKSREQLLNDVLDPSRVIDNNYAVYLVRTKSGSVLSGLIAAQTESSLTLRRGEGQQDVVLRTDIEDLRSSGLSLMPEGLEKAVSVEAMADLLSFLKGWRDLEGR